MNEQSTRSDLYRFCTLRVSQRRDIATRFNLAREGDNPRASNREQDHLWLTRAKEAGTLPDVLAAVRAIPPDDPG